MLKNNKANVLPGQHKQPGLLGRVGNWFKRKFSRPQDDFDQEKAVRGFRMLSLVPAGAGYLTAPGNHEARKAQRKARRIRRCYDHS